jgi:hypothetical protein
LPRWSHHRSVVGNASLSAMDPIQIQIRMNCAGPPGHEDAVRRFAQLQGRMGLGQSTGRTVSRHRLHFDRGTIRRLGSGVARPVSLFARAGSSTGILAAAMNRGGAGHRGRAPPSGGRGGGRWEGGPSGGRSNFEQGGERYGGLRRRRGQPGQ